MRGWTQKDEQAYRAWKKFERERGDAMKKSETIKQQKEAAEAAKTAAEKRAREAGAAIRERIAGLKKQAVEE